MLLLRRSFGAMLVLAVFSLSGERLAGQSSPAPSRPMFAVPPEPFVLRPGEPLSVRTLVQRPPLLAGALGWSIETRRHRGYVYTSALHPDGKRLATGGLDGIVRIWDVESGAFIRALVGHNSYVYGLAWSPDGKTLASAGSHDGTARLWDASTGMTLRTLKGHKGYTQHVAWSPDGRSLVVAGGSSGFLTLWDLTKKELVNTVEVGNPISDVAWCPNNRDVAVAGRASGVQVRELRENTSSFQGNVPDQYGTAVAWSPDGKTLVGGSPMKSIVWELEGAKVLHELEIASIGLAFSPDGSKLAISTGRDVKLLSSTALNGKPKAIPLVTTRGVEWSPDGANLFGTTNTTVARWSIEPPKSLSVIDAGNVSPVLATPGRPFVAELNTKSPSLWDTTTGKAIAVLEGHTAAVSTAAWSRDGKLLATASADKTVRVWDAAGKPIKTLKGHEGAVSCVAWADAQTLASGSADKTVRVWHVNKDAAPKVLAKHTNAVAALAWNRDGKMLASGAADSTALVWQVETDKPPQSMTASSAVRSVAWAGTGATLAVGCQNGDVQVFNIASGKLLQSHDRTGNPPIVSSLATGPDGATLLAGKGNHTTQVWRIGAPNPLLDLRCLAPVSHVAWGAAGAMFISCVDRSARVHDPASGVVRTTVIAGDKQVSIVSATGHYRVTDEATSELVYVVQTPTAQETLTPKEFATRFRFRNIPANASLPGGK